MPFISFRNTIYDTDLVFILYYVHNTAHYRVDSFYVANHNNIVKAAQIF